MALLFVQVLAVVLALNVNAASVANNQSDVSVLGLVLSVSYTRPPYQPLKSVHLVAPDGSAKANFIPFGATTTNFWVKDKVGGFLW